MEEKLKQVMYMYRRDELSVNNALMKIKALLNAPKNTIHNNEYKAPSAQSVCSFCEGSGEDQWNERICPECQGTGEEN